MVDKNNNGSYKDLIIKNKDLIIKIQSHRRVFSDIIIIIVTLVLTLYFTFNRKGNYGLIIAISLWSGLFSLIMGFIYSRKKDPARYLENYDFDFYKEFNQYKLSTIGVSIQEDRPFKNHTEWKAYIIDHYRELMGSEDFYRQLILKLREQKIEIENLKSISMPIEILVLTFGATFLLEGGMEVLTGSHYDYIVNVGYAYFLVFCASRHIAAVISEARQHIYFIKDLVEILFLEKKH